MNPPEAKTQALTTVPAGMILIRRLYHPVEGETDREYPIAYKRRNLASLAEQYGQGQSVICTINDQPVPRNMWKHVKPKPGSVVAIAPVVGFWIQLGALIWNAAVYAAVGMGMAYLGGLMFNQDPPERKTYNDHQTRGWNLRTTAMEGIPYQREYGGPFAAHGNAVAKWTDVNVDGDEVLHLILCYGDKGPSVGTVAGEMYIQDQPIGNYDGVTVTERLGTMDQTAIAAQNKLEIRPGTPVSAAGGAVTVTTSGKIANDLEYTLEFDRGIWQYNGMGERESNGVGVKVEITKQGLGSYTTLMDTTITGNQMTPIYKAYTVSDQGYTCEPGYQYELQVTHTTPDDDPGKNGDTMKIRAVREVIDVAFTRPGKPLVYIQALATEQLNSDMDVKAIRKGRLVRTYNGSAWSIEWSNNRADIWLDQVTQPVIDGNGGSVAYSVERYEGLDPSNVNLSAWYEWRAWCADHVTDGNGGTEDRMVYNGILNTESDLWTTAHETAEIGRAKIFWQGTILDLWLDKEYTGAIDLVTFENVMDKSWKNSWAQHSEMAGKVTVMYDNAADAYKRQPLPIPNEDAGSYKREIQIEGVGVTQTSMATRIANYALYRNKLIRNVNTVDMHKDAIRFRLGKVVRLQHNKPDWGKAYRIRTVTGAKTLELDRSIQAVPGDPVYLRAYDASEGDAVTAPYTVDTARGTTLVLNETLDPTPAINDILAIGSGIPLRRIIRIEQAERPQYHTITLETYTATLFGTDDFEPYIRNAGWVVPTANNSLVRPVSEWQVRDMIQQALPPQPSMDIPRTANIAWTGNSVDTGYWAAETVGQALLFNYKGVTYEITAGSTTDNFIYWDPNFTDQFRTTNDGNTALATGNWLMATNVAGVMRWATPMQLLHAAVILAGTIRADAYLELIENYVVNGDKSCDASHSFIRGFDIVDTMTTVRSVLLSVRIGAFRAYTTGAAAGGAVVASAAAGGSGLYDTTGAANWDIGGSTGNMTANKNTGTFDGYTDYYDTGHTHNGITHDHDLTPPSSTDAANGAATSTSSEDAGIDSYTGYTNSGTNHRHTMDEPYSGHNHDVTSVSHSHDLPSSYSWTISSEEADTYGESANGNHRHQMNNHLHVLTDHTHELTGWSAMADHDHGLSLPDHQHTVTLADHTHAIVFGIYEETNAITWHYHVDNGAGYGVASASYTADQRDMVITSLVTTTGLKHVKIDVSGLCNVEVDVKVKLEITA